MGVQPSAFRKDPLGWASNQSGHIHLGAQGAFWAQSAAFWITGELLSTWGLVGVLVALYQMAVEYPQGWKGWDTIEDGAFVGLGALGVSLVLEQLDRIDPVMYLSVGALTVYFMGGMYVRYRERESH